MEVEAAGAGCLNYSAEVDGRAEMRLMSEQFVMRRRGKQGCMTYSGSDELVDD